uniref:Methyltransferase type 12 n=1 Tax=Solibacter usitatus (strain Ellin6076) TaxID=234267 RepID=Q02BE5_SOLUE
MARTKLTALLGRFRIQDGVYSISESRSFQHPEEAYDQQYGSNDIRLDSLREEGAKLFNFFEAYGFRDCGPVLEIGCGTGRLSIPLAVSGRLEELLLTDASRAFCAITSRKLTSLKAPLPRVSMAVLLTEDLDRLPQKAFSAVLLRSVLHHVADIPAFFGAVSRILAPGGLLIFEEPCHEGYLLMGAITQLIPDALRGRGISLSSVQSDRIRFFVSTMQFYARRDIDKSLAEDKHLFRPDELMSLSHRHHMELQFFPNRSLDNIDKRTECLPNTYFETFYLDYLKYCMSWDEELLKLFSEEVRPYFEYFSCLAGNNALPYTYGTFLCRKLP